MAGPPDPHVTADYGPLVEALAREGLPRRTEAVRAVEAVACALSARLDDPAFEPVRELLPEPFRGRLVACERHAGNAPRRVANAEQFYASVADDLGRPPEAAEEVEAMARAVFAALRAQLPEEQADEVAAQLPEDLEPLWRRLS